MGWPALGPLWFTHLLRFGDRRIPADLRLHHSLLKTPRKSKCRQAFIGALLQGRQPVRLPVWEAVGGVEDSQGSDTNHW